MAALYHVVAMARNRVIGKDNKLPWHFPADLKFFKQLTMDHTVIMGRKTFESIHEATKGKLLPGRTLFVLTRDKSWPQQPGTSVFNSFDAAFDAVRGSKGFIIGGAEIFNQTLDRIHGIYLTQIDAPYDGDVFYPEISSGFEEKSRTRLQDEPVIEVVYYENTRKHAASR